ncbi:MAG: cobalamin-binding protein, partial [Bacillota bacterium]
TLAERPRRIVSLAPSNTEILFAVGAGNQVVGVTLFDDFPAEVRSLEKVGGFAAKSISVEKVVGLEPDLVLTAGSLQQPVIDALRRLGIPVFSVDSRSLDHLYDNIRKVGRLTGHAHRAEQVVRSMQARVEAVRSRVAAVEPSRRARVFYEVWDNPLMTAGPQTFIGQLIELAGGINIFSDVQREWPQVSLEELIRRNPDVILGPSSHGRSLALENLRVRTGWHGVRAVQTGRVYLIEDSIVSRPGPRLVQGLEAVARALYPELFPEPPPDPNAVPQQALPARR